MLPHIFNGNGTISIMIDGKMKPVDTAHGNYDAIKNAIIACQWDIIPNLINIKEQVESAIQASATAGKVTIENGEVFYNNKAIHNTLTERIIDMVRQGFDIGYMVKFLENLMKNPSFRAVNELYGFLESGAIPITENGTFLAYKKIRNDWTDIHSGTFDNSIGAVCEMPRNMVDEDSSRTCSAGLHVCSYDYLAHFSRDNDDRVVICEINPADVVSIPADYNNTKMRVCKYTVIGEVEDYKESEILNNSFISTNDMFPDQEKNKNDWSDICTGSIDDLEDDESSKNVGKSIQKALEEGNLHQDDLENILASLGVDKNMVSKIGDYVLSGKFKKAGKAVTSLIDQGQLIVDEIVSELLAYNAKEIDTDALCKRCGAVLNDEECSECGFYNMMFNHCDI